MTIRLIIKNIGTKMTKFIMFLLFITLTFFTTSQTAVLKGTVSHTETNAPVAFATISSSQNSQTIMTNEDGSFILFLDKGETDIVCSHIAYYTKSKTVEISSDTVEIQIFLNPSIVMLPSISVYERNYDAAQAIIIEAIRHKDKILAKLNSYNFDAYTKLLVSYESKQDTLKPFLFAETELKAYWRYPSEYKEIITARKQSSNLEAGSINITVANEVLNFNNNRVKINDHLFVSPTAKDALEYYNYYLLDTLFYDTLPVFLLEVEPKNNTTPLFIGTIQINAHTYEIMGVDFSINEGLDNRVLKKLQLIQEFQLFEDKNWMPIILKYNGFVDVPIPFIPNFSFAYTAALQRYQFDREYSDTTFENPLEIDKNADDFDSTQWLANRFIPLTAEEEKAYDYIDTAEFKIPLKLKIMSILPGAFYAATNNPDIFHFNKIEGAYLGYKKSKFFNKDKIYVYGKLGYAFDAKLWQQEYAFNYTLSKKYQLKLHTSYHDNIQKRKTLNSSQYDNATGLSLLFKHDPFDYYREKGFTVSSSFSPIYKTSMSVSYNNLRQFSIGNNSDYSLFHKFRTYRENPKISDGKLRSIKLDFKYDSNERINNKGKEESSFSYPYTSISIGAEISDKATLKSDFDFSIIYGHYYTSRLLFNMGISSLSIYGTTKLSGNLPPQRYTVMDYGSNIFDRNMMFRTLHHSNFSGSELLSILYRHQFGTKLFKKSHLPLIKKIPFSLSVHGGVFWSEFTDNDYNTGDELITHTNRNPYSEIGFAIGRLPMMTKVSFTWQLSAYDTNKFFFGLGFDF